MNQKNSLLTPTTLIGGDIYARLLLLLLLFFHFLFYVHSNTLSFDNIGLFFAVKMVKGTYNFVSVIVKIILSQLSLVLSLTTTAKTQCFVHRSYKSTLHLINEISSDLQKLIRYFNDTAIVVSSKISFASVVLTINLVLYLKDLKASVFAIAFPKSSASTFE